MGRLKLLKLLVCGFALASAAACASCGGGEAAFDGRVLHAGRSSFKTGPIPSSWERLKLEGPLLAFHDKETDGAIDVYAQCGKDADDVPLVALTKHLLIGFTERDFKEEKLLPLDGREALHTRLDAKLDGVLMSLDIYVFKKDGCVYDLVYVAYPDRFPRGVSGFASFVAGFGTVGG
ncbi:MAG: hypothetical protein ABI175_18890 [Polyangiales bacterium]